MDSSLPDHREDVADSGAKGSEARGVVEGDEEAMVGDIGVVVAVVALATPTPLMA